MRHPDFDELTDEEKEIERRHNAGWEKFSRSCKNCYYSRKTGSNYYCKQSNTIKKNSKPCDDYKSIDQHMEDARQFM